MSCLQAQTEIAVSGLTSEVARGFIERLPGIEALMPALSFSEVAGEAEPPVAEQLVTPNTLRQRRYRERQAALRNGQALLPTPCPSCPPVSDPLSLSGQSFSTPPEDDAVDSDFA